MAYGQNYGMRGYGTPPEIQEDAPAPKHFSAAIADMVKQFTQGKSTGGETGEWVMGPQLDEGV